MRAVILRSLAVIGAGGVLLAGLLYVASTVDARPPEVLSIGVTQPVAGETDVALITTSIEVTFSEPVETDAAAPIRLEPEVEGATSWSGSTLIFTPADPLALETEYVVTIDGTVRDRAGNAMDETPPTFSFVTAGRPTIVATDPVDGSEEVPLDATVAITFSSLMDTASVEEALRIRPTVAHDLRWSGDLLEIVPSEPLRPGVAYVIAVGPDAADAAGVEIGERVRFGFRTVAAGLRASTLVPADGIDGIAVTSPVAVVFDRAIDPGSVDDEMLAITPDVAGSLEVVPLPGSADAAGEDRAVLFVPSGPLPANTTFEVELASGIEAADGGTLAEPLRWTFTTGTPSAALSNQIAFVSDRAGVPNVWAMNPDGTGQHQVTAELAPVLDYAVAPDGSSLVVADGRRLVWLRPDGSDRRVITGAEHVDADPAFAPDGQRLAFARLDAETGAGLGLWVWDVGGGEPEPLELPDGAGTTPTPSPDASGSVGQLHRGPRFSPDGSALAFVEPGAGIGMLELPAQRLTFVPFAASAPPIWLPDSSAVIVHGAPGSGSAPSPLDVPVAPMAPGPNDAVFRLNRSGTEVIETALGGGWRVLAVSLDGSVAYTDADGALGTTDDLDRPAFEPIVPDPVAGAAFSPDEDVLVAIVGAQGPEGGTVERVELATGRRVELALGGWLPRWLP